MATAGIRNNNPGNIMVKRAGRMRVKRYETPQAGYAALNGLLVRKYNNRTALAIFKQYAPYSDGNNPRKYANFVISELRRNGVRDKNGNLVNHNTKLDMTDETTRAEITLAICKMENGHAILGGEKMLRSCAKSYQQKHFNNSETTITAQKQTTLASVSPVQSTNQTTKSAANQTSAPTREQTASHTVMSSVPPSAHQETMPPSPGTTTAQTASASTLAFVHNYSSSKNKEGTTTMSNQPVQPENRKITIASPEVNEGIQRVYSQLSDEEQKASDQRFWDILEDMGYTEELDLSISEGRLNLARLQSFTEEDRKKALEEAATLLQQNTQSGEQDNAQAEQQEATAGAQARSAKNGNTDTTQDQSAENGNPDTAQTQSAQTEEEKTNTAQAQARSAENGNAGTTQDQSAQTEEQEATAGAQVQSAENGNPDTAQDQSAQTEEEKTNEAQTQVQSTKNGNPDTAQDQSAQTEEEKTNEAQTQVQSTKNGNADTAQDQSAQTEEQEATAGAQAQSAENDSPDTAQEATQADLSDLSPKEKKEVQKRAKKESSGTISQDEIAKKEAENNQEEIKQEALERERIANYMASKAPPPKPAPKPETKAQAAQRAEKANKEIKKLNAERTKPDSEYGQNFSKLTDKQKKAVLESNAKGRVAKVTINGKTYTFTPEPQAKTNQQELDRLPKRSKSVRESRFNNLTAEDQKTVIEGNKLGIPVQATTKDGRKFTFMPTPEQVAQAEKRQEQSAPKESGNAPTQTAQSDGILGGTYQPPVSPNNSAPNKEVSAKEQKKETTAVATTNATLEKNSAGEVKTDLANETQQTFHKEQSINC